MDALRERDGVGSGRYHGWPMDARDVENSGRRDVFGKPTPPNTVSTDAFEASTPAPPLPPGKRDRRDVFGCKVHETPQIPMWSACARRG